MKTVDLRSDTLTVPTPAMRDAMQAAQVGDDVFGEDPTINKLQEKIAELTGKEAALFVCSGTQGNQISVNAHTQPGQEVICDRNCHIFNYESGAGAMLAGIQLNGLDGHNGILSVEQITDAIRPEDDHYPQTGLICLENTHNRGGGNIYPLERMKNIYEIAQSRHLPVHLDGARLWNASVATGIPIKEYCRYTDSVSLCFSKGLGAPVGSIVAGSKAFIKKAHFYRKAYGGGIRQGGILAAAALYALEHHFPKLQDDHRKAKFFAQEINQFPGIFIDPQSVETNIVIFNVDQSVISTDTLVQKLQESGILMFKFGPERIRAVFYLQISNNDVQYAVDVFRKILC